MHTQLTIWQKREKEQSDYAFNKACNKAIFANFYLLYVVQARPPVINFISVFLSNLVILLSLQTSNV